MALNTAMSEVAGRLRLIVYDRFIPILLGLCSGFCGFVRFYALALFWSLHLFGSGRRGTCGGARRIRRSRSAGRLLGPEARFSRRCIRSLRWVLDRHAFNETAEVAAEGLRITVYQRR